MWDLLDRVQAGVGAVVDYLARCNRAFRRITSALWREIISAVPLFVLFLLGERGAGPTAFLWCLAWLAVLVLAFNPFDVFYNVLAPKTRVCAVCGLLLAMCAAALWWLSLYGRLCFALLGAALEALAWWKRKAWLLTWQTLQCPAVDQVLSHLAHGEEWTPGKRWEAEGCRQVRSMLHQALDMECNEAEIDRSYKAVYLLAFLCGLKERENEVERLKKERDKAEAEADKWRGVAVVREDNAAELDYVKGQLEETRAALTAAQDRARQYSKELEAWKPQEAEGGTEAEIIAYCAAGHSYQEAADRFGTNKTRVYRLVKQAGEPVEDGASGEE